VANVCGPRRWAGWRRFGKGIAVLVECVVEKVLGFISWWSSQDERCCGRVFFVRDPAISLLLPYITCVIVAIDGVDLPLPGGGDRRTGGSGAEGESSHYQR
jgi:hypothetical protein